jgi:hypothetical protein
MIGIALALFLIGMLIWKKYYSKQTPTGAPHPTVSTSDAKTESASETSHEPGDQQPGHQVERFHPYSYQHHMKKLPEERERYWNNIQSDINDEFN